jgi:hypothetical protein
MRRLLLFLCLVGAAVYWLTPPRTVLVEERISDAQAWANRPVVLRSWGPTLKSLRKKPHTSLAASQEPTAQGSEQMPGVYKPSASMIEASAPASDNSEQQPVAWARVIFAARAHSAASVSSPTIRFYQPGTELQVVRRANGWFELANPVTQERGWVFQKYLVSIESRSPVQAVKETATKPPPVQVASPKSQKPSRSIKLTARVADDVEVAKSDRRRDRLARRLDRRRGLFRFRDRNAGVAAWSLGPMR